MGNAIAVPKSMQVWCAGVWDFGMLGNSQTGSHQRLQLHATITKSNAHAGLGFHLSAYALGEGGYLLADWNPSNAVAKSYYYPTGLGTGAYAKYQGRDNWGPKVSMINGMPYLPTMESEAWAYFLTLYPGYKAPVVAPKLTEADFPKLGR